MKDIWKNSQSIMESRNRKDKKPERKSDGKKFKGYDKAGTGCLF